MTDYTLPQWALCAEDLASQQAPRPCWDGSDPGTGAAPGARASPAGPAV